MAGGINISASVGAVLGVASSNPFVSVVANPVISLFSDIPTITQPIAKSQVYSLLTGPTANPANQLYVFDATLSVRHSQNLNLVKAPLQTGYNISYHAVLQQANITLEIGMSDAMAAFQTGMWEGNISKSVSAFQTVMGLMANRVPLTLSTRLMTYQNMMIVNVSANETNKTIAGLRATITLEQIFIVAPATLVTSSRPNATGNTQLSTIQSTPVPAAVTNQHAVTSIDPTESYGIIGSNNVPAGGAYDSNVVTGGK